MTLTKGLHLGQDESRARSRVKLSLHLGPDESRARSRVGLGSHLGLGPNAKLVRFTFHVIIGKGSIQAPRPGPSPRTDGGDNPEGSLPRWRCVFSTASSPLPDSIRASWFGPSPCKEGAAMGCPWYRQSLPLKNPMMGAGSGKHHRHVASFLRRMTSSFSRWMATSLESGLYEGQFQRLHFHRHSQKMTCYLPSRWKKVHSGWILLLVCGIPSSSAREL